MAINFPNSPSVNDIHVSGANRWQWNGSSWTRIGGAITDAVNSTNDNSTTTLYPVMVTGTGSQTAKIATTATKNISFDASDGNLTVGGNISAGGTITYEDVTNVDSVGVVTARAGVKVTGGDLTVGTAATISSVGNITAGIVTAASGQLISGVGIDTSGTVVGYAATIIHFRGPGVSTAYYSATTGVGTVYFQGGGGSASVSISESAPSSPSAGDMWWDSDVGNLQIYYTDSNSSQWVTANNSGPQGPQGAQGVVGAQGAQGYQGVQGSVGIASLTISTGAPSSPAAGDMWWDSDDGDLHLYYNDGNSSQWININAGSAGAQGVQGSTGAQGHQGRQGAGGSTGAQGVQGSTGAQGVQGAAGITTAISSGNSSIRFDGSHDIRFISSNNTRMYLDSDKFLVGAQGAWSHKAHYGDNNWSSDKFWVASPGGASQVASFALFGNNAMPCEVAIQKSRSNTVGSMSALQLSDPLGALQFNGSPDNNMRQAATFACYVDSSGTISNSSLPTNLRFYTNPNGAVIPTEKLRITSAGKVGINSTSPTYALEVDGGTQNTVIVARSSDTRSQISFLDNATTGYGHVAVGCEGNDLFIRTGSGSKALTITSGGKVGIGEDTPLGKLHVKSADSGASVGASADELVLENSSNTGMTILSGTTGEGGINFGDSGDVNQGRVVYVHNGDYMHFHTNSAERLRITSDGNIQIGAGSVALPKATAGGVDIASGSQTVCLGGNVNSSGRTNSTDKLARITSPHYTNAEESVMMISAYNQSGTNNIGYGGGSSTTNTASQHTFYTAANTTTTTGTERLRITSAGDIQSKDSVQSGGNGSGGFKFSSVDTACVLGIQQPSSAADSNAAFQIWDGSSNNLRINYSGLIKTSEGIDFSGAQTNNSGMTSEVLDSYEEGTFTPSINGMGSISYSVQAGKYTKIGNTVFFQIRFNLSSRTAGSHAHITNMPFTASTATIQYAQCTVYAIQGLHCSSNHHPIGQFQSSEIYLYQVGYQSSSNYSNIDENQISGTAQFGVYGFYYTAS